MCITQNKKMDLYSKRVPPDSKHLSALILNDIGFLDAERLTLSSGYKMNIQEFGGICTDMTISKLSSEK